MKDNIATHVQAMTAHAKAFLASARMNLRHGPEQASVAFEEARHAAEVAGKALYLAKNESDLVADKGKSRGRGHAIGPVLAQQGLIPKSVNERDLSRLLRQRERGAYGYLDDIDHAEVTAAIEVAAKMVEAAESYPNTEFHPPRQPLP